MKQIAIAFDQFLNTVPNILTPLFPNIERGYADETISARAWRCGKESNAWERFRVVIDALFFWQKGHCFQSYLSEAERKHLPPEYSVDARSAPAATETKIQEAVLRGAQKGYELVKRDTAENETT